MMSRKTLGHFQNKSRLACVAKGFYLQSPDNSKRFYGHIWAKFFNCFRLRKLIKKLFKTNHARALTIGLQSAAVNSSNILSMPQVDRGDVREDSIGNEVVKCSIGTGPASTPRGHRPTPEEIAARSKMHRLSAGRDRTYRCTSRSEDEGVRYGRRRAY